MCLQAESGLEMDQLVRCDGWHVMMGELLFSLADHKDKVSARCDVNQLNNEFVESNLYMY